VPSLSFALDLRSPKSRRDFSPVGFNDHVISALATASSCSRPTCPNQKRLLQEFLRALLGLLAGFHRFIERDAKVNALIARPFSLAKIGLGRVNIVKTRGKFSVAAAHAKTIAVVVRSIDIAAISQLDPFFAIARPKRVVQKRPAKGKSEIMSAKAFVACKRRRYDFSVRQTRENNTSAARRISRSRTRCVLKFQFLLV